MPSSNSTSALTIEAFRSNAEVLAMLGGKLVLENCDLARKRLQSLVGPDVEKYFLDMNQLEYVDSAGWGTMVGLKMVTNRSGIQMSFLSPSPRVLDIFHISKLDSVFEVVMGAEAEVIRTSLQKPELLLWREAPDQKQVGTSAEGLRFSGSLPGSDTENKRSARNADIERLSKIAIKELKLGNNSKVIDAYLQVLDIDAEDLSALNNLGVIYEKRPEWKEKAIRIWNRVLKVSQGRHDLTHSERAERHLKSLERP